MSAQSNRTSNHRAADRPVVGQLGPYQIVRPISAGGMARVYEGRLDSLAGVSTRVAIKVIHPEHATDAAFQELFITEARISARLEHQNLVRVQAFNREGEWFYLVMELIDGLTLRKVISLCRRHQIQLPVSVIAELGRQVCEGLDYAHSLRWENGEMMGLVHRDIKPSNLMLTNQGIVKVLDFGISYSRAGEVGSGVKGTWGYMALEQIDGRRVGPPADVYGLSAVLFELATLEPLFEEKDNTRLKERMLEDEAARRAAGITGTYAELGAVLVRGLQRDAAARFSSCAAMSRALTRLITNPMTIREDLVLLGQNFRGLDENSPGAKDRVRSITTVPSNVEPRTGSQTGLPIASGTVHGPIIVPPDDRPKKEDRTAPSWISLLGVGALMSVVGGGVAAGLVTWMNHGPENTENTLNAAATPAPIAAPVPVPAPVPVAQPTELSAVPTPTPINNPKQPRPRQGQPVQSAQPVPVPVPTPTPAPAPAVVPPTGPGILTISASVKAKVYIDGNFVKNTPVFKQAVPPGNHHIRLETEDGRFKEFDVTVSEGQEVRKMWNFTEGQWM